MAFITYLPTLSPQAYSSIRQAASATTAAWQTEGAGVAPMVCGQPVAASKPDKPDKPLVAVTGNVERGRQALYQYASNSCCTIPGVTSSFPNVGPPLQGLASRSLIAGKLANTPHNLALWMQHPKSVKPLTAMPDMGVTDAHAADIVAYLATLQ